MRIWRLAALWGLFGCAAAVRAQGAGTVCAEDAQGRALPGAQITVEGGSAALARTGADGCVVLPGGVVTGLLQVRAAGFAAAPVAAPGAGQRVEVTLQPAAVTQTVTVTADRGLAGVDDQATSIAVLDAEQLGAAPALALDDRLRQVAGFQLFRRTSSWTANPTTEGVSLRGLGSTAASRTLVVSDQVPLNDPFGGWIHWDEIPSLAIADVQLERGGAADLYGSSAVGGVIAVDPVRPAQRVQVAADALGATEKSGEGDLLVSAAGRPGSVLLAGSGVDTGGYIPTAPAARGRVDVPAKVAEESGRLEWRTPVAASGNTAFLRGNVLNEVRGNGTADQTNGTRLWRYLGGGDLVAGRGEAALRVFGDRETYRQSFSAIAADRESEVLTRLQRVPTDEFGFSATGSQAIGKGLTAGLGLDLRDVRATDAESPVSGGVVSSTVDTSAHQRELGGYAEAIWQPRAWSVAGSVRVDSFQTFDGRQVATNKAGAVAEPEIEEVVTSPHLGVTRQLAHGVTLTGTANAFRAFRGPTMNELYRTGQVGQQTTLANPSLLSERATGFEFGAEFADGRVHGTALGHVRASYFWTEVNRPVSAVLLSQTATAQTLQRQNLGQIRSRGVSVEAATARWRGVDASFGYQLAVATVTAFNTSSPVQANLTGNWIPEVPREMLTAVVNYDAPRLATLHLIASYTGRAFDDANNQFLLHPYPRFDVSAERRVLGRVVRGLSLYAGVQNVADRAIDAGRTPVLTLAAPRLIEAGLRYRMER